MCTSNLSTLQHVLNPLQDQSLICHPKALLKSASTVFEYKYTVLIKTYYIYKCCNKIKNRLKTESMNCIRYNLLTFSTATASSSILRNVSIRSLAACCSCCAWQNINKITKHVTMQDKASNSKRWCRVGSGLFLVKVLTSVSQSHTLKELLSPVWLWNTHFIK